MLCPVVGGGLESGASALHAPARSGAPCDWGHFPALSLVPKPCLDPVQAGQAEAAQAGAWPSVGRECSCPVFGVEVAIVPLLAASSITALFCFSQLLKISLGLESSVSSAASLSHLLPSPMSQGTMTSKEVHQHAPWGLGEKTFLHPAVCGEVWHRQGVPGSAMKTRVRKGGVVVFYVGTPLQHNGAREQGCPHTAALYATVGKKSGRTVGPTRLMFVANMRGWWSQASSSRSK